MSEHKIICDSFDLTLQRLAFEIIEKNLANIEQISFAGIRKRGVPLANRIAQIIKEYKDIDIPVSELDISLYTDDQTLISNEPVISQGLYNGSFRNRIIILIDDILNSGRTVRAALEDIYDHGRPKEVQLCVMADLKNRILPISADYIGKVVIPDTDEYVKVNVEEVDGLDNIMLLKKEEQK